MKYDQGHIDSIPFRTSVPMKATEDRSPSGTPGVQGSVIFRTTSASPVKLDSSTSRSTALINRTSAGIRTPTEEETISPGRRLFARTVFCCESLRSGCLVSIHEILSRCQYCSVPKQVTVMRHQFVE